MCGAKGAEAIDQNWHRVAFERQRTSIWAWIDLSVSRVVPDQTDPVPFDTGAIDSLCDIGLRRLGIETSYAHAD